MLYLDSDFINPIKAMHTWTNKQQENNQTNCQYISEDAPVVAYKIHK